MNERDTVFEELNLLAIEKGYFLVPSLESGIQIWGLTSFEMISAAHYTQIAVMIEDFPFIEIDEAQGISNRDRIIKESGSPLGVAVDNIFQQPCAGELFDNQIEVIKPKDYSYLLGYITGATVFAIILLALGFK